MQIKLTVSLLILAISSMLVFSSGCNGVKSGEASFGSLNIAPPPPPPAPPAPLPPSAPSGSNNGAEDDAQFFYLAIKNDTNDAVVHVHDATDFNKTCSISKDSLAHEDIMCMIDIPEGDIYAKNTVLQYNVPKDMCRYLVQETYWFYNLEVGIGPSVITVSADNTVNASGDITNTTYTCAVDGVVAGCAAGHPEVAITGMTPNTQNIKCVYDDEKNCCLGKYTLNHVLLTNGASADVSTPQDISWGGNMRNCIGGPAKTNWNAFTTENVPTSLLSFARPGIKNTYLITAPLALGTAGLDPLTASIHVSNWYAQGTNDHTHSGFVSADTSTSPYFIAPIDDRDGSPIPRTNETYNFICLDESFEIKHRIRAYIREWDYYPDFLNFVSSAGVTVAPDRASFGSFPGETDPTCLEGITGPCDDFLDIDDFLNLIVGPTNTPPSPTYPVTSVARRRAFFPAIAY